MELLFTGGFGILQLLVLAGLVGLVAWIIRNRRGSGDDPGIGTLKRLYFYGLSFVALMVAASGATALVDHVADGLVSGAIFSRGETQLALGLAMFLVGTPVWLVHWTLAQRSVSKIPWESQSVARRVYFYLVLAVAAATAAAGFVWLIRWGLGYESFNGMYLALPLVWGAMWVYHWLARDSEHSEAAGNDLVRQIYIYFTAWYGLAMLTVGVAIALWQVLRRIYDALAGGDVLFTREPSVWNDFTVTGLAIALVGAVWWWWHWHRLARADRGLEVQPIYLQLFTILPGSVTVLVTLTILIFRAIEWGIAQPSDSAAQHFAMVPGTLAAGFAGAGLWAYHYAAAEQLASAAGVLNQVRRIYRYLVAAIGLTGSAAGVVILVVGVVSLLDPLNRDALLGSNEGRTTLALAIALLLAGVPLWAFFWLRIQQGVRAGGRELDSLSRRIYLYAVFGVAALLALGNLSAILFMVLRDVLEGSISAQALQDSKWSIGMLLTAVVGGLYHWLVFQEDRQALEEAQPEPPAPGRVQPRKLVIALAAPAAQAVVSQIEDRLGFPIRVWHSLDPEAGAPQLTDEQLDAARDRISAAPGDRVLITLDASGVGVLPFRE